jgi:uncharacterized protein YoxC
MTATTALGIAALVAALVVSVVAVYALIESVRTMRSMQEFIDETNDRLQPLMEKADVSLDAINAELLRVDGIVTTLEEVSDKVGETTRTVHAVANAPKEVANAMGPRLRSAFRAAVASRRNR